MMHGFLEFEELHRNYEQCKKYTRQYARTFYFASHVLPKQKRYAAYAVYAFCRYADEIVDSPLFDAHQARQRLDDLREQLRRLYQHSPLMDARLRALQDTVMRYGIPQEYFVDLLRGVEMDLDRRRFATFEELQQYCYCVASTVGLIMARIFGVSDESALASAVDLGTAMQLTNILRDVGEDLQRGRIYLPEDELNRFGYSPAQLTQGILNDEFRNLMRFNIERARWYYQQADRGIPCLTDDGSRFCVRLMRRTYARILDDIERYDYDVFHRRAYVPGWKKLTIAIGALVKGENVSQQETQYQKDFHSTLITAGQRNL
jgi:phytoene synthase